MHLSFHQILPLLVYLHVHIDSNLNFAARFAVYLCIVRFVYKGIQREQKKRKERITSSEVPFGPIATQLASPDGPRWPQMAPEALGAVLLLSRDWQGLARRLLGPGRAHAPRLAAAGTSQHCDAPGVPRQKSLVLLCCWIFHIAYYCFIVLERARWARALLLSCWTLTPIWWVCLLIDGT